MTASAIERRKRDAKINKAIGRSNLKSVIEDSDETSPSASEPNTPLVRRRKESKQVQKGINWGQIGVYMLIAVVIGSSFVQIITNIWTQPSMSEAH